MSSEIDADGEWLVEPQKAGECMARQLKAPSAAFLAKQKAPAAAPTPRDLVKELDELKARMAAVEAK